MTKLGLILTLGNQDIQIVPNNPQQVVIEGRWKPPWDGKLLSICLPTDPSIIQTAREIFLNNLSSLSFYNQGQDTVIELQTKDVKGVIDPDKFRELLTTPAAYSVNLRRVLRAFAGFIASSENVCQVLLISTNRFALATGLIEKSQSLGINACRNSQRVRETEQDFIGRVVKSGISNLIGVQENAITLFEIGHDDKMAAIVTKLPMGENNNSIIDADRALNLDRLDIIYQTLDDSIKRWWNVVKSEVERVKYIRVGGPPQVINSLYDVFSEYIPMDLFEKKVIDETSDEDMSKGADLWREFYSVRKFLRFLIERHDFLSAAEFVDKQKSNNQFIEDLHNDIFLLLSGWAKLLRADPFEGLKIPPKEVTKKPEFLQYHYRELILFRNRCRENIPISAEAVRVRMAYLCGDLDLFLSHLVTLYELLLKRFCVSACPDNWFHWAGTRDNSLMKDEWKYPTYEVNLEEMRNAPGNWNMLASICLGPRGDEKFLSQIAKNLWRRHFEILSYNLYPEREGILKEGSNSLEKLDAILNSQKTIKTGNPPIDVNITLLGMRNLFQHQAVGPKTDLLKQFFVTDDDVCCLLQEILTPFETTSVNNILDAPLAAEKAILTYLKG